MGYRTKCVKWYLGKDGEEYRLVREEVVSRDFIRLVVEGTLKVDFVNDRVFRYGTSWVLPSGYRIDNLVNILTNKIGTIVDREEPLPPFPGQRCSTLP